MGKKTKKNALDPESALLAKNLSARDLVDLIHEVNPTGLELPPREADHRYTLKSRLQSLLIRRFPEDLRMSVAEGPPGFVALELCRGGRNACHARLDSLDAEARSWVQRQLDTADHDLPDPLPAVVDAAARGGKGRGAVDSQVESLLAQGLAAQESYDFEAARQHFEEARVRSGQGARPALLLLTLLVDHLAADEEALGLRAGLSAEAAADTDVRLLLAQAAARSERDGEAADILGDIGTSRAAPVLHLLCRRALSRGDLLSAEAHLHKARALDPAHADGVLLHEELSRARAAERKPLEERMQALFERGQDDQAAAAAREVLSRWPESRPAGRVLRAILDRQKDQAAQALLGRAEQALREDDRRHAVTLLREAAGTAADPALREQLAARLSQTEAAYREGCDEQAVRQAVELLQGGADLSRSTPVPGLLAYGQLDARLRERVRACIDTAGHPALLYIDELLLSRPDAPVRPVAEAAAALAQAQQLARERPDAALSLIHAHERYLCNLSHASLLISRARDHKRQQQRQQAEDKLRSLIAPETWRGLTREARLERLDAIDLSALSEPSRAEALSRRQSIQRYFEYHRLRSQATRLCANQDPLGALALLDEIQPFDDDPDGKEARSIEVFRSTCKSLVVALYHVLVDWTPGPPDELCDIDLLPAALQGLQHWLTPDGLEVVLAVQHHELIWIRRYHLIEQRVTCRMLLAPNLMLDGFELVRHMVLGHRLFLLDSHGAYVQIGLATMEIQQVDVKPIAGMKGDPPDPKNDHKNDPKDSHRENKTGPYPRPLLSPDGQSLWLAQPLDSAASSDAEPTGPDGGRQGRVCIRDIRGITQQRELKDRLFVRPLPGAQEGGETLLCCPKKGGKLALHTGRGLFLREVGMGALADLDLADVTPHPGGQGLLLLSRAQYGEGADQADYGELRLHEIGTAAGRSPGPTLPGTLVGDSVAAPAQVVTGSEGMIFVLCGAGPGTWHKLPSGAKMRSAPFLRPETRLVALRDDGRGLRPAYQVRVPQRTVLLQGLAGGQPVALTIGPQGVRAAALGQGVPQLPARHSAYDYLDRSTFLGDMCLVTLMFDDVADFWPLFDSVNRLHQSGDPDGMGRCLAESRKNPRLHVRTLLAELMVTLHARDLAEMEEAAMRTLDDPWCRLWMAHHFNLVSKWDISRKILEAGKTRGLVGGALRHYYHVYAAALLHLGRHDAAVAALRRGEEAGPGPCVLHNLRILAEPLPRPLLPEHWGPEQPLLLQVYGAIHTADRCLAASDPRGAIAALDRNAVYMTEEIQAVVRLAHAFLLIETTSEGESLRRRACLMRLVSAIISPRLMLSQLPFRGKIWSQDEIGDVARRLPEAIVGGLAARLKQTLAPSMNELDMMQKITERSVMDTITQMLDCVEPQQIAAMVTAGKMKPDEGSVMLAAKLAVEQARQEGRDNPLLHLPG